MARLFIVDDDVQTCELLLATCSDFFAETFTYHQAKSFLSFDFVESDTVLLDLQMPDMDGVETIRHLAKLNCKAALVLISGYDEGVLNSAEELARRYGLSVLATYTKPCDIGNLVELLQYHNQQKCDIELVHDTTAHDFVATEQELVGAMENRHIQLFFQPQINLKTNQVVGAEALSRWFHPSFGIIHPDDFVPLAEQSGLIEQLTSYVIDEAVKQSSKWQRQGKSLYLSVNLSAQNIVKLTMPEKLQILAENNEIDPSMLALELTESGLVAEKPTSLDILTRLRLKGFNLSIDDFGIGYSSLALLHRIPFTELKLDKSFVFSMTSDAQSHAIVETCIMLAHKLNMKVVAEGVEDVTTLSQLKDLNCDIGQGFYFAKPMSGKAFDTWYENYVDDIN